jgi:glutamine synthetase
LGKIHSPRTTAGALGEEVVEHYANNARVELAAYDRAITGWELFRGFERLVAGGISGAYVTPL